MSLQQLTTPINPVVFVKKFEGKFQKWGNAITNELKDTWEQNCLVFNNVIANKTSAVKYIVSAPTGSAKTENTITYCAMLPTDITVLISTNLTIEADRLAATINKESGDSRACSHHSKNKITIDQAKKHQVVVVTHAYYKENFKGTQKWDKLGQDRDLIIIDEAINTMRESRLTLTEINIATNLFSVLLNDKRFCKNELFFNELKKLLSDYNTLSNEQSNYGGGTKLLRSDTMIDISESGNPPTEIVRFKLPRYRELISAIERNKLEFNRILTGVHDESNDTTIRQNILATLYKLNDYQDRQVYITASQGEYSFNRVVDFAPKQSIVCFDATSDVNEVYKLRQKYHRDVFLVPQISNVRDYSPVNLHVVPFKTGRNNINKQTASEILDSVQLGSKTLIVTHKPNVEFFENIASNKYSSTTIDVVNWGAVTGLNKWQDFDTCIIAGLNHKRIDYAQNRTLINTDENIAFGSDQDEINNEIVVTDLVAEIIQAMNRIRIRKVINENGQCDPANIYVTLPSKDYEKYIDLIKQHMTNVNVSDWDLITSTNVDVSTFDQIVNYLKANCNVGDKVNIFTPRDALSINSETYRSEVGKTDKKQQEFKNKLEKLGFEIIEIHELDGRGRIRIKPTKYINRLK